MFFNVIIRQIVNLIKIRDINDRKYTNFDYVNLNIYFKNNFKKNRQSFTSKKNVHVMNNLRVKILININIIVANITKTILIIKSIYVSIILEFNFKHVFIISLLVSIFFCYYHNK